MGKFEKKKNTKQNHSNTRKKSRVGLWITVILIVACCLLAGFLVVGENVPESLKPVETMGVVVHQEKEQPTEPEREALSVDLGQKLFVTDISKYAGIYMEDGTDELVDNVLMLKLTNKGDKTVEYAEITVSTSSADAKFAVSTLPPGATAILLEKSRMPYSEEENYTNIQADFASFFAEPLEQCEDILQIQVLDGAMNITNIADRDIAGPVRIYYKNVSDDIYYGGITYRRTLENGLKAGELQQIMADHLYQGNTAILYVECEEA